MAVVSLSSLQTNPHHNHSTTTCKPAHLHFSNSATSTELPGASASPMGMAASTLSSELIWKSPAPFRVSRTRSSVRSPWLGSWRGFSAMRVVLVAISSILPSSGGGWGTSAPLTIPGLFSSSKRRAKLRAPAPKIPMEARAEKALEAIYVCCFGRDLIDEEDEELLCIMLSSVFRTVRQTEIERIVGEKAKRVAEGTDEIKIPEPKALPKEAVQLQMKDLQFLREGTGDST